MTSPAAVVPAWVASNQSRLSVSDASVYSLATMTTFEIPGLTLPPRFQMLSALEAMNGVLLFGISTAFLFAVISAHWQLLSHRREGQ